MRKSHVTIQRRIVEAQTTLDGFTKCNIKKFNIAGGYSYTTGYYTSLLSRILAKNVSEEVFKEIMHQVREETVKNFVTE